MAFGIGGALKRSVKSAGRRLKDDPLKTLVASTGNPKEQIIKGVEAGIGAVQDVIVPEIPELPDAITAPIPDDERRKKTRERAAQRKYAKGGRAGTMLTNDDSKLG